MKTLQGQNIRKSAISIKKEDATLPHFSMSETQRRKQKWTTLKIFLKIGQEKRLSSHKKDASLVKKRMVLKSSYNINWKKDFKLVYKMVKKDLCKNQK